MTGRLAVMALISSGLTVLIGVATSGDHERGRAEIGRFVGDAEPLDGASPTHERVVRVEFRRSEAELIHPADAAIQIDDRATSSEELTRRSAVLVPIVENRRQVIAESTDARENVHDVNAPGDRERRTWHGEPVQLMIDDSHDGRLLPGVIAPATVAVVRDSLHMSHAIRLAKAPQDVSLRAPRIFVEAGDEERLERRLQPLWTGCRDGAFEPTVVEALLRRLGDPRPPPREAPV